MRTQGVQAATSRRVAEAAGAPLASIHYTFGSTDALVVEAYRTVLEELLAFVEADVPWAEGFGPALGALADRFADALEDDRFALILRDPIAAGDERIEALAPRYYAVGPDVVRRIASSSGTALTRDPDQLGRLLTALIDGVLVQVDTHGDLDVARRDLAEAAAMLAAWCTQATAAPPRGARRTGRAAAV
jgi:AcrR family transcriptional regulator